MSYNEYNDMFLKCQEVGLYHVFTFDIKNSKGMNNLIRLEAQKKLYLLANKMYEEIEKIEQIRHQKILLNIQEFDNLMMGINKEPFFFGDMFGFTMYRDSLMKEEVINIFNKLIFENNIKFSFHISDGYYETNKYSEGNKLYYRGYCIELVSNLHKKEQESIRKKLIKKQ